VVGGAVVVVVGAVVVVVVAFAAQLTVSELAATFVFVSAFGQVMFTPLPGCSATVADGLDAANTEVIEPTTTSDATKATTVNSRLFTKSPLCRYRLMHVPMTHIAKKTGASGKTHHDGRTLT